MQRKYKDLAIRWVETPRESICPQCNEKQVFSQGPAVYLKSRPLCETCAVTSSPLGWFYGIAWTGLQEAASSEGQDPPVILNRMQRIYLFALAAFKTLPIPRSRAREGFYFELLSEIGQDDTEDN